MIEDPQSLPLPTPQPTLPLWSHTKSVLKKFSNSSHLVDVFHFLHVHQTYSMISYLGKIPQYVQPWHPLPPPKATRHFYYCISKPLLRSINIFKLREDFVLYLFILFCFERLYFCFLGNVAPCVRFPATWGDVKDTSSAFRNSYLHKPTWAPTMFSRWRQSEIELHCLQCLKCSQWHTCQHTLLYGWSVSTGWSSETFCT